QRVGGQSCHERTDRLLTHYRTGNLNTLRRRTSAEEQREKEALLEQLCERLKHCSKFRLSSRRSMNPLARSDSFAAAAPPSTIALSPTSAQYPSTYSSPRPHPPSAPHYDSRPSAPQVVSPAYASSPYPTAPAAPLSHPATNNFAELNAPGQGVPTAHSPSGGYQRAIHAPGLSYPPRGSGGPPPLSLDPATREANQPLPAPSNLQGLASLSSVLASAGQSERTSPPKLPVLPAMQPASVVEPPVSTAGVPALAANSNGAAWTTPPAHGNGTCPSQPAHEPPMPNTVRRKTSEADVLPSQYHHHRHQQQHHPYHSHHLSAQPPQHQRSLSGHHRSSPPLPHTTWHSSVYSRNGHETSIYPEFVPRAFFDHYLELRQRELDLQEKRIHTDREMMSRAEARDQDQKKFFETLLSQHSKLVEQQYSSFERLLTRHMDFCNKVLVNTKDSQ
ncbi:hypothetical protein H4R35_007459, partial [Dimargaris xerosporica]